MDFESLKATAVRLANQGAQTAEQTTRWAGKQVVVLSNQAKEAAFSGARFASKAATTGSKTAYEVGKVSAQIAQEKLTWVAQTLSRLMGQAFASCRLALAATKPYIQYGLQVTAAFLKNNAKDLRVIGVTAAATFAISYLMFNNSEDKANRTA